MTARPPIDMSSTSIPRVTAVIAANPGITSKQIAAAACYALSHTKNVLTVLSRDGVVKPVPQGYERGWYLAALAEPLLQQWERTRRRRNIDKPRRPSMRDAIHALSKAPEGVRAAQLVADCGLLMDTACKHCAVMVRQGRIYLANRDGCRRRWFDTAARAAEWEALPAMEPSEWAEPRRKAWELQPRQPKPAKPAKVPLLPAIRLVIAKRAKVSKPAPVSIKVKREIEGPPFVDYSHAKRTLCASPTHHLLYQVDPETRVSGGFATAGIGRYLDEVAA